jgi:predicted kinase
MTEPEYPGSLFILIGLPRSGKSTIASRWAHYEVDIHAGEIIERDGPKARWELTRVVVRADDIRLTFGHRFYTPFEQYVHAIKTTMIKTLLLGGNSVLVDGTHTTEKSIVELLRFKPDADYAIINTSPEVCRQRAIDTSQPDLFPVIDRMAKQLSELPPMYEIKEKMK